MNSKELLVKIWDVKHGHAVYIKTPNNRHIIIDLGTGSYSNGDSFSPINHLIANYSVQNIDLCVVTHPHLDHIDDILNLDNLIYPVIDFPKNVDNNKLLENCRESDKEKFKKYVSIFKKYNKPLDDSIFFQYNQWESNIKIFRSLNEQSNINDVSSVFVIEYEGIKIVIPGDNEKSSWNEFLENSDFKKAISNAHIFLASHHGRESGYHYDVLKIMNPFLTVISDSKLNETSYRENYGKMSKGWKVYNKNSEKTERKTLSTYNDGSITIKAGKSSDPAYRNYLYVSTSK